MIRWYPTKLQRKQQNEDAYRINWDRRKITKQCRNCDTSLTFFFFYFRMKNTAELTKSVGSVNYFWKISEHFYVILRFLSWKRCILLLNLPPPSASLPLPFLVIFCPPSLLPARWHYLWLTTEELPYVWNFCRLVQTSEIMAKKSME